jgi:hypothetical protein
VFFSEFNILNLASPRLSNRSVFNSQRPLDLACFEEPILDLQPLLWASFYHLNMSCALTTRPEPLPASRTHPTTKHLTPRSAFNRLKSVRNCCNFVSFNIFQHLLMTLIVKATTLLPASCFWVVVILQDFYNFLNCFYLY